jgi:hypothetical protein
MVSAKNPTISVSSISFNNSSIQDASLNVPPNSYGNAVRCVLLQVTGTDLSNNILVGNSNANATNNTQAFSLSKIFTTLLQQSFFGAPSISIFNGYISGTDLYCIGSAGPMQICPTYNVTGSGVAANTIIIKYNISDGSGNSGKYPINISQTVGSLSNLVKFTCTPQPVTFIGALSIDPATTNKFTTTLYTNQGNAYKSGGFPVIGMTLTGNAITFGGTAVNVKILDRSFGSATNPFFDQTLPSDSPVITSTPGQMLLTTFVDASGALFRGLVTNPRQLTVTSIQFGIVRIGHFLTGCNNDRSAILSNPAPSIISFNPSGSYSFVCKCSNGVNASFVNINPNNFYTIPDIVPPKPYIVYISGNNSKGTVIPANTYYLIEKAPVQNSPTGGIIYKLNMSITIAANSDLTLTVTTTSAEGSGGIGVYTLSSNQPTIAISNTSNLLSGPEITGTLN